MGALVGGRLVGGGLVGGRLVGATLVGGTGVLMIGMGVLVAAGSAVLADGGLFV
ncbi:MAG TPA: hypothetical protein VFM05_11525 [Candidatus Saccharimonadales bacterium]|nr:hypothetical protein [Candidatus Saccharimonadales bacterium]